MINNKMFRKTTPVLALTVAIAGGLTLLDSVTHVASAGFVNVPSQYVYDPSGRSGRVSLHDYCTKSPDEFPNPAGRNADFRGPCARHDLCYASRTDKKKCDARLLRDMYANCRHTYSARNPARYACFETANTYFRAVVAAW